ncbi:sigma-70 family RNA polymerase sigma factor [Mycobacterium kiyosense]|nr:hypothetical protein IWGMT90018_19090 [Mycobacterium kiyosense]
MITNDGFGTRGTLIAALRAGDEGAFARLVDWHTPAMLRVARGYVPSREHAEDVVQETWIALLKGLEKFEDGHPCVPGFSRFWLTLPSQGLSGAGTLTLRSRHSRAAAVGPSDSVLPAAELAEHQEGDRTPTPFPDTPEGSLWAARTHA